ncbi:hypothetical protein, partial [Salmonella sp. SAL4457]|uniref:hypothetical protein n=1 Tax=Salmonella sp. SAL4457 TaxID=3159912 RepID=UPI00397B0EE0
ISATQNIINFVNKQNWLLTEPQYEIILNNNKNIANNGTDQQKIDYYHVLNRAVTESRDTTYHNLYANLEIHFRVKCKPL